jgi:radical SAM protein with 4Fe4S-binding SPASM domain
MECPHIPEISYTEFSKRIYEKVRAERIPYSGVIELSFRCNHNCVHCYVSHPPEGKELTYQEICDILDVVVSEGCLFLLITGGEPLIRSDFLDIYKYAKKKGLIITLFTNGTLITDEIADYFKEWPPDKVEITIHGITKETYEKVTGVKGSFDKCMRGIHLLLERKIPLNLKTVVMTVNKHEIGKIKKYVEELGLDFRFDAMINAGLEGNSNPCMVRISPEEVVKLDIEDEERTRGWTEFCEKFWGPVQSGKLYNCGAGLNSFHIDPYGKMSVCTMSRYPNYDLRYGSFHDGYYNFFPKILAQKLKDEQNKCDQCEMLVLCGQCPGLAQLESDDPEKPVEYLCRIAHLRAAAFKKEVNQKWGKSNIKSL